MHNSILKRWGREGKRHICDMQFADVACALKTQTAINI